MCPGIWDASYGHILFISSQLRTAASRESPSKGRFRPVIVVCVERKLLVGSCTTASGLKACVKISSWILHRRKAAIRQRQPQLAPARTMTGPLPEPSLNDRPLSGVDLRVLRPSAFRLRMDPAGLPRCKFVVTFNGRAAPLVLQGNCSSTKTAMS